MFFRALFLSLFVALPLVAAENPDFDVIVYGGSSAGVIAATQAARMGKSTLLLSPNHRLGGMTASGLGATDVGDADTIGGLAREFYSYVGVFYRDPASSETDAQFQFEPHVAETVFMTMLRDAGAKWIVDEQLDRKSGVSRNGSRIAQLQMKSGRTFSATMFIDATYEGDLMAAAGVSYRIGRESRAELGESLAGVCRNTDATADVDPYLFPTQPLSGLLPGVASNVPGADGTGDARVQQYNLRLCMTDVSANRVAITRPTSYDRADYELLARRLRKHPDWQLSDVCKVQSLPGHKADINATGLFSTDKPGDESTRWAEASDEERAALLTRYHDYTQGLLWFLAHDPAVPPRIAQQAGQWGLAKDEFTDTDHWPWQLYVREARRMTGSYLITQRDCESTTVAPDSIALASYGMDSHFVTVFVGDNGEAKTEGFFFAPVDPYPISYRAIVPKPNECTNLLVPVCLSATHVAFSSIRMEPVFMMLGQSAATAACLAIDGHSTVQQVNYSKLARRLLSDGQILTWSATAASTNTNTTSAPSLVAISDPDRSAQPTPGNGLEP